jgi:hypothetical protein
MNEPINTKQLRQQVASVLVNYGLTVDEFLQKDLDDFDDILLRDLALMVKSALTPQQFGLSEMPRI